jgi:sugar/nucleoside kinase (ribokinase family)
MDAISTAGAGDALLAGTIAGLIAGMPLKSNNYDDPGGERSIGSAIDLGLALAAFSVTSRHTIHSEATLDRLLRFAEAKGFPLSQGMIQVVITSDSKIE